MSNQKMYQATLLKGETYVLRDKTFRRNIPQPVTAEEMAKLRRSAIDKLVSRTGDEKEVQIRQKFKFVPMAPQPVVKKSDKLKELEAMQGDGGVADWEDDELLEGEDEADDSFDEDVDADEEADEMEELDDEEAEDETPPPAKGNPKKVTSRKPVPARKRNR